MATRVQVFIPSYNNTFLFILRMFPFIYFMSEAENQLSFKCKDKGYYS